MSYIPAMVSVLLAMTLTTVTGGTEVSGEPHLWQLQVQLRATRAVLTRHGVATGVGAAAQRSVSSGPFFVGWQAALNQSSEANADWQLHHDQIQATLSAGVQHRVGAGTPFCQLGLGVLWIREAQTRHDAERLAQANVPGVQASSYSIGPYAFIDAGVRLNFWRAWSAVLSAGPALTRQNWPKRVATRLLWHGSLGVAYGL